MAQNLPFLRPASESNFPDSQANRVDEAIDTDSISPMNIEKIRKRVTGGFQPFVLRTSDGRKYSVPHPEFIMFGKFEVAVVDRDGDIDLLDPLHIVSLKSLTGRNGAGAKATAA